MRDNRSPIKFTSSVSCLAYSVALVSLWNGDISRLPIKSWSASGVIGPERFVSPHLWTRYGFQIPDLGYNTPLGCNAWSSSLHHMLRSDEGRHLGQRGAWEILLGGSESSIMNDVGAECKWVYQRVRQYTRTDIRPGGPLVSLLVSDPVAYTYLRNSFSLFILLGYDKLLAVLPTLHELAC